MSSPLPPELIQVKRKRRQDEQLTYLRVEDVNKRRQSGAWLYRRREPDFQTGRVQPTDGQSETEIERGCEDQSKPPDKVRPSDEDKGKPSDLPHDGKSSAASDSPAVAKPSSSAQPPATRTGPRRFHLWRNEADTKLDHVIQGGVSKRSRYGSAIFVERDSKPRTRQVSNKPDVEAQHEEAAATPPPVAEIKPPAVHGDMEVDQPNKQPLKRPGVTARRAPAPGSADGEAPRLPPSFWRGTDVDMDELARDMHAYTLEQIGYTLAKQEEEKQRDQALSQSARPPPAALKSSTQLSSRLKPKQPAQRWAERNPEEAEALRQRDASGPDKEDYEDDDDDDEGDYVMETYYRIPDSAISAAVPAEEIGVLVLDTEPDVEYFYGGDGESDDEDYADDDEDENAENHYTADYPDDELDSDDEFGRNPYRFRTQNASDLEEYDYYVSD